MWSVRRGGGRLLLLADVVDLRANGAGAACTIIPTSEEAASFRSLRSSQSSSDVSLRMEFSPIVTKGEGDISFTS